VTGVQTTRGAIKAKKVGIVVAGRSSQVAAMAGMRLPIESHVLQAFVTEGLKPCHRPCRHLRHGAFLHQPVRQGRAGLRRRSRFLRLLRRARQPAHGRACDGGGHDADADDRQGAVLRSWGGIMDMSPDGSPIIDRTHIDGLYLNCGWCYGGFKAVPGSGFCFAHLMATDRPHEAATRYRLDRFATGRGLMDEEGTGSQHNLH
jgi:glycine/D-amino acid oxidase-like deaminating enzyme